MRMQRIPFNLKILDTCLPDYFQGFDGPVISFPVDARMTYEELVGLLTDDDAWPSNADIEDIRAAVIDLTGNVHLAGSKPFSDIAPDEPPASHFVSRHPTLSDMWLVIDKEDGEVMSSWPSEEEAMVAAWDDSGEEPPPDVYAYFGIELEVPDGYVVAYIPTGEGGWVWGLKSRSHDGGSCDTEMEAKVAAWRHCLANEKLPEFVKGQVDGPNGDDNWTAGIDHQAVEMGGVWHNRIEVHGFSKDAAEQLRDRVFDSLK